MTDLANTGERILPDKETPLMIERHFSAYRFAKDYCEGKKVLEIGCGEGYGSNYLAGFAKSVVGIDYSVSAIEHAQNKYQRNNLKFALKDVSALDSLGQKFDVICCFQVIEHIANTDSFLKNIRLLFAQGGEFIVSTCNKSDSSPGSGTPLNKFHIKEYLFDEFKGLLEKNFKSVDIVGLKRSARLNFYRRLKKIGILKRLYTRAGPGSFKIVKSGLENALDFIAICR